MGDGLYTSRDVKLRPKPQAVEPLGGYDPALEDLDIREQELELEEDEQRSKPRVKGGLTSGQLILIVIIGVIVLVTVILLLYYAVGPGSSSSVTTGPATYASVGQSCSTMPCASPLVCEDSECKGSLNGPCLGPTTCSAGYTCFNNQCLVGLFGRCKANSECAPGLTCSQATCITAP